MCCTNNIISPNQDVVSNTSNCPIVRSKIIPESIETKLLPDRVYKENRANWNANYTDGENFKQTNANWSLPVWNETMQLKNWNQQSQSATKNARKVSAKQHYLSVARYVAGQTTNLSSRNGDTDSNQSRLTMNGMIGPFSSAKYEEYNDNFWGPRENVENQTRQHYLSRNRFIAEQNSRIPYPSVYEQPNKSALQTNLFGTVLNVRGSGSGLHGRTDWAAKYLK